MLYPRIYLAIDNCFAYKRWTQPGEWCELTARLGIRYIEASQDNELDPLLMGAEYLADWIRAVRKAETASAVKVVNCYSGHGTYTTLGLVHTDRRVRRRLIDEWFKPILDTAAQLGAGFGFYVHAFSHETLQDGALYAEAAGALEEGLIELNRYAASAKCGDVGIEQMYSPHQYPWTIDQTRKLLRSITEKSGHPFYFTEDVGHHQKKFLKPAGEDLDRICAGAPVRGIWLGSDRAYALAEKGRRTELEAELERTGHLFAEEKDGDCYAWLSELGCYSPIIHLQQTDGHRSAHLPFTEEQNRRGIIDGGKLLRALKASYDRPEETAMPKRCEKIYLTLELFTGTAAIMRDSLADIGESAAYWRRWIPRDGMYLNELIPPE
jgi:hypothetical protein